MGEFKRKFLRGERDANAISAHSASVLDGIQRVAGIAELPISSMARTPAEQAKAMLTNMKATRELVNSVWTYEKQLALYREPGKRVIRAAGVSLARMDPEEKTLRIMVAVIEAEGPQNVSRHCGDAKAVQVFDVPPSLLPDDEERRFVEAARAALANGRISKLLLPAAYGGSDPAIHIEIRQEGSTT